MKALCKLDILRMSFFSRKVKGFYRVLSHSPGATPDLNLRLSFLNWHYFMSRKHSSWKDNEIVYCHLLTRNLASFSVRQLFGGPTCQWMSSPRFSLVDAFKLSA